MRYNGAVMAEELYIYECGVVEHNAPCKHTEKRLDEENATSGLYEHIRSFHQCHRSQQTLYRHYGVGVPR